MRKTVSISIIMSMLLTAAALAAAPVLQPIGDKNVDEGQELSFLIEASDADADPLTFGTNASGTLTQINGTAANYTWTPGFDDAGSYDVLFNVTDGTESDSETITITIDDVNRQPEISTIPDQTAVEGEEYTYQVDASDPDGDDLLYSLETSPAGMDINGSGFITWTPPSGSAGTLDVTVLVTDGELNNTESYQITVSTPSASLSLSSLTLGDENTERQITLTGTVSLRNTGSSTITNISMDFTGSGEYNVSFTGVPASLAAGASTDVTVEAYVPLSHDAGVLERGIFQKQAVSIGSLIVEGVSDAENPSDSSTLSMEAKSELEISDADVEYDGQTENVEDGDEVDDVRPGVDMEVTIEAENNYRDSDDEDWDIEDVTFAVIIDNGDLDIDEDDDLGDIRADESGTSTLTIEIDEDADDDTYEMFITIEGEDENGALHGETFNIDLRVERDRHEIRITDLSVSPTTVSCVGSRSVRVTVEIQNIGRDDEDRVAVKVESDDLGYSRKISNIELDEDDSITKVFDIPVDDDYSGTASIIAYAYYDNIDLTDDDGVIIEVRDCADVVDEPEDDEPEEEEEPPIVINPPEQQPPVITPPTTVEEKDSDGFTKSTAYIATLVVLVLVLLVVLAILIGKYLVAGKE